MPHPLLKISFRTPALRFFAKLAIFSLCLTVTTGCQMFWVPNTPPGYVLPRPEIHFLNKKLNEISGLFFLKGENSMLAIADDKRHVFRVYTDGSYDDYFTEEFGPGADYEDVIKVDSSVFVLSSDASITEIRRGDSGLVSSKYALVVPDLEANADEPAKKKKDNDDKAQVDFETIYYDSSAKGLILLSKNIKGENKAGYRSAWRFDLQTHKFDAEPFYKFHLKDINNALKDGRVEFKPSAAAISPLDHRLYILSSAGHLLVVADLKGHVEEVYRLNPSFYPQAEGIAFAENGDMYISNEAKLGKASLLRIPYERGERTR
jgi:hypothetical protein